MLFSILITTISVQFLGLLWVSRLLAIRSKSLKQIQADLDDARQIKTDFLSIAREFTDLIGGRIWVESASSDGCMFALALPT